VDQKKRDRILGVLIFVALLIPLSVFWRACSEINRDASRPAQTTHQSATAPKALAAVQAVLDEADPDRSTFASISAEQNTLTVTVTSSFLAEPKSVRLEAAKNLHTLWAGALGVGNPDDARIRLVTQSGQKVGGSAAIAGGIIEVDD
jgi:hypothetical protein